MRLICVDESKMSGCHGKPCSNRIAIGYLAARASHNQMIPPGLRAHMFSGHPWRCSWGDWHASGPEGEGPQIMLHSFELSELLSYTFISTHQAGLD